MRCILCGKYSKNYDLCYSCYCEEQALKQEVRNIENHHQNKFYQEDKIYIKKELMNEEEKELFFKLKSLTKGYFVFPQISLRSIISTPYNPATSEELYKYIDFVIFDKEFIPVLAIELNGNSHFTNAYTIARDKSNQKILEDSNIPLLTLWLDEPISDTTLKNRILTKIKNNKRKPLL